MTAPGPGGKRGKGRSQPDPFAPASPFVRAEWGGSQPSSSLSVMTPSARRSAALLRV